MVAQASASHSLAELGETQLVGGADGQARMLQNVVEIDLVHGVLSRVDQLQVVIESRLEHHGAWVARLGG